MQTGLTSALSLIGRHALRIVLPAWCDVCGRELPWRGREASCCAPCWSLLPKIDTPKCRSCALPLPAGDLCIACSADPLPLDWCDAWGEYSGGLERLLQAFKFGHHEFLDASFAALLHETLVARGDLAFDAVVAVPMHWSKERKRGYNQAELLAASLAKRIGMRADKRLLTKPDETPTQSLLSRGSRAENVRKAFKASPRVLDLSILVVDDICTTGETLRACSRELVRAGAARVCAITVAKAV